MTAWPPCNEGSMVTCDTVLYCTVLCCTARWPVACVVTAAPSRVSQQQQLGIIQPFVWTWAAAYGRSHCQHFLRCWMWIKRLNGSWMVCCVFGSSFNYFDTVLTIILSNFLFLLQQITLWIVIINCQLCFFPSHCPNFSQEVFRNEATRENVLIAASWVGSGAGEVVASN